MTLRLKPKPPKMGARVQERRDFPRHRQFVRRHACVVPGCDGLPIQCAHVRLGTDGGTGLKPSDWWCVPLCVEHHFRQHGAGEESFWAGRDAKALALSFAMQSPVPEVQEKARILVSNRE
jgi:hypothetical protein